MKATKYKKRNDITRKKKNSELEENLIIPILVST